MPTNEAPATLPDLHARWDELEFNKPYPVGENWCRYCGSEGLTLTKRLRAVPGALSGVQVKTSAASTAYLKCNGCGHESEGK
jgi:hypothetical protein